MEHDLGRLEDISRIRDAMRQISQEATVAVDLLDAKIDDVPQGTPTQLRGMAVR